MKCLGAQWMVALYEHLTNNPYVIVNGFRHAGVFTALGLLDDTELPDYSEMSGDSDYQLSDDEQSQEECDSDLISDSEGGLSHDPVCTEVCLSVGDVFMSTEENDSD